MATLEEILGKRYKRLGYAIDEDWRSSRIEAISTGIPSLDQALECGGIPRGRITTIYGRESTGKSLLCETLAINAARKGVGVLYIDYENSIDPVFLGKLGMVDADPITLVRPVVLEDGFEIAHAVMQQGETGLIVFDSVGAMLPRSEVDDSAPTHPASLSRALSVALGRLLPAIMTHNVAAVFVNHVRANISAYPGTPATTMAGGNALKYYTHILLRLFRKSSVKGPEGEVVELVYAVNVEKNKCGKPFGGAQFRVKVGGGIDVIASLVDSLEERGIIEVGPTGWVKSDLLENAVRGRGPFVDLLRSDKELLKKFLRAAMDK